MSYLAFCWPWIFLVQKWMLCEEFYGWIKLHCVKLQSLQHLVLLLAPSCQQPICQFYWLGTSALGSFSVRWSVVIFSFERQSHWESICCFTRQWKLFKSNRLLLVCVSNSPLSWEVSAVLRSAAPPPPLKQHPTKWLTKWMLNFLNLAKCLSYSYRHIILKAHNRTNVRRFICFSEQKYQLMVSNHLTLHWIRKVLVINSDQVTDDTFKLDKRHILHDSILASFCKNT